MKMKMKTFVEAISVTLVGLTSLSASQSALAVDNQAGGNISSIKVVMPEDSPLMGQILNLVSGDTNVLDGSSGVVSFSGKGVSVSTTAGAEGEVMVNVNNNALAGDNSSVNAIVNINVYVHGSTDGGGGDTSYFQGGVLTNELNGVTSALPADCGDSAGSMGCWQLTQTEVVYPLEPGISTESGENIPLPTDVDSATQGATIIPPVIIPPQVPVTVVVPPTPLSNSTSIQSQQSGSVLNGTYRAEGQTLSLSRITSSGTVSEAILMGTISNSGWVSNSTVGEGSTLTGGTLTGSITNEGTIKNVDFRGSTIEGGTLDGTIDNSRGGTIKDVALGPDAHLKGGDVVGTITGDCTAPAILEDVTIKADSQVSCVSLEGGTVEEGAVVTEVGENPVVEEVETPPADTEEASPTEDVTVAEEEPTATRSTNEIILASSSKATSDLPLLGTALAVNKKGKSIESESIFAGGIALADAEGKAFQQSNTVKKLQDTVDVKTDILVDADDVGTQADIFVYADYQITEDGEVFQLMLDKYGSYLPWNGEVASLEAFQSQVTLEDIQPVTIYQGTLLATGILKITVGYRLKDGTVVLSPETIDLTVTDDE